MTPSEFVEVFKAAALGAGQVAKYLQGKVRVEQKAGERTAESAALTAVDLAAQDVILHQLLARAPHVAVDAEEDTPLVERFPEPTSGAPLVVIDPIDGTLNYTRGLREYAVMGALIVDGIYQAAVVLFPAYERLYSAVRGEGCRMERNGARSEALKAPAAEDRVLVAPRVDAVTRTRLGGLFGEVDVSRCSAVDSSIVALGWARASLAERRSDRRRAIGYLLSREAGGVTLHGDQLWTGEDPELLPETLTPSITAGSEQLARQVLELVRGP